MYVQEIKKTQQSYAVNNCSSLSCNTWQLQIIIKIIVHILYLRKTTVTIIESI